MNSTAVCKGMRRKLFELVSHGHGRWFVMLIGMLSHLIVIRSMRKRLAGTIATAAAELC